MAAALGPARRWHTQLLGQGRDAGAAARRCYDPLGRAPGDVVTGRSACGDARSGGGAGEGRKHATPARPGLRATAPPCRPPTLPDGLAGSARPPVRHSHHRGLRGAGK